MVCGLESAQISIEPPNWMTSAAKKKTEFSASYPKAECDLSQTNVYLLSGLSTYWFVIATTFILRSIKFARLDPILASYLSNQ